MDGKALVFAVGCLVALVSPAAADDVEMELKVGNGVTERTHYITQPGATMMECVFHAPIIATQWMNENLIGEWVILRLTCGPPRRRI
jgi:hypothetical protein